MQLLSGWFCYFLQASTTITRGPWPIVIGAVWDARGTEEIARALKGVDCDLDILQRRRPWDAVACERHGKLQSAYSDDSTQAPGERPRFVNPQEDALGVWLSGTNGQASPGGHRSYRQAPQVEGQVEGKLTPHVGRNLQIVESDLETARVRKSAPEESESIPG